VPPWENTLLAGAAKFSMDQISIVQNSDRIAAEVYRRFLASPLVILLVARGMGLCDR
jgi:hypothetical protein